jgi:hypothetical protein
MDGTVTKEGVRCAIAPQSVLQCLPFVALIGDNKKIKKSKMSSLPLFFLFCEKIVKFVFIQIQSRELGSDLLSPL